MSSSTIRDNRPHGKHLALFIPSLAGGGVAKFILHLAKSFVSRGHKIDLLLCRVAGPYLDKIPAGVKIVQLKASSGWRGRSSVLSADHKSLRALLLPILLPYKAPKPVNFLPDLVRYLQCERPDVLFSAKTPCNLVALWAKRLAGGPTRVVVSERSSLSPMVQSKKEWRWRFVLPVIRRVYPWADGIVSVSKGVGNDISLLTGIPRERITTIYNPIMNLEIENKSLSPVNHPWFAANGLPIILGVGRLVPQKDFPCLMRAFRHVRSARRVRLVILGEGRLRRELEALAKTLGISQDVSMPGFTENPYAFMARASVLTLSSAWEGFANVIAEALACGCPVVSTDCPSGPAEVLKNGAYGTLVPVGNDKALAEAILAVLDKPPEKARLRARASEFNVDSISEDYLRLLIPQKTTPIQTQSPANFSDNSSLQNPLRKKYGGAPESKHLAIFLPSLAGGGVARAMLYLAEAFANRNHRVDLILCQVSGPYLDRVSPKVKIVGLKGGAKWLGRLLALSADFRSLWSMLLPILLSSHPPKTIGYLPDLVQYLRREKPDTMFTAKTPANLTALWACRLAGGNTRLVINEQTSLSPILKASRKWRWRFIAPLLQRFYPWADEISTVSDGVADDFSVLTGIPRDRFTTIYNPVAINQVQEKARIRVDHPWFTPDTLPVILGVGRLVPQKDFACLIKAFGRVLSVRPARLVILGEGRKRRELEELATALGLTQDISMPGFVDNPFSFMARASVFVLSSAWEGCPNVLIEALACGCPVVSTDCPSGPAEILKKGLFGPLVPAGNDKALAEAILTVLDNPPDQEQLCTRASEFEVGNISEKYLKIFLANQTSRLPPQNQV